MDLSTEAGEKVPESVLPVKRSRLASLANEHLGLLVTFLTAALVGARVMAVAGWSPSTATILIATQGPSSVVAGTLLSLIPLSPMFLLAILNVLLPPGSIAPKRRRRILYSLLLLTAVMVPTLIGALLVIELLLLIGLTRAFKQATLGTRTLGRAIRGKRRRLAIGLMAGPIGVLLILQPNTWLPIEAIQSPGQASITGYVIAESDDHLTVLRHSPRVVVRVKAEDSHREYCSLTGSTGGNDRLLQVLIERSAVSFLFDPGSYPRCATAFTQEP